MLKFLKKAFKANDFKRFTKKIHFIFGRLKSLIPIKLGKNSVYGDGDYRNSFLFTGLTKGTAEKTKNVLDMRGYECPSGDRQIDVIKELSVEEMDIMFWNANQLLIQQAKRLGAFKFPVSIATDPCDIPYYGNTGSPFVVGTKHKLGTNYAHSYGCTDVVVKGERFTLAVTRRTMKTDDVEIIENGLKIAKTAVKIAVSLADREFYNVDVVNIHKMEDVRFIIPAKNTDGVKEAKKKHEDEIPITVDYTMKSRIGIETDVNLSLVYGKKEKEIYGFINDLDAEPKNVAAIYRTRWGVETGNRMRNNFRGRTCSQSYRVRYFYFLLSTLLYNFWVLVNMMATEKKYGTLEEPLITFYELQTLIENFIERQLALS